MEIFVLFLFEAYESITMFVIGPSPFFMNNSIQFSINDVAYCNTTHVLCQHYIQSTEA